MSEQEKGTEAEQRKTLKGIVAELRMGDDGGKPAYRIGRQDKVEISMPSGQPIRSMVIEEVHISELAEWIEAAAKREGGNAAAMREALETLRTRFDNNVMAYQDRYLKFSGWHWHKKAAEAARWRDVFQELKNVCDAALAEPPRQCDVGKAEEQYQRWVHFCEQRLHSCHNCECKSPVGCTFKFGDMPYIKEGGKV